MSKPTSKVRQVNPALLQTLSVIALGAAAFAAGVAFSRRRPQREADLPVFLENEGPASDLPAFVSTTNARELFDWKPGQTVAEAAREHARRQGK